MQFWKRDTKSRSTERRHRITVLRITRGRASGGYTEKSTEPSAPYWASVEPLTETQRVKFQSVSVDATHRITVDAAIQVSEGDRIEFQGRQFDVMTVRNADEGRRDKVIITQEIRPGQKR